MKVAVESLLGPITPENPCGDPIEYDPQYIELESLLRGKQETQFAAAEEPDWKAITSQCLELFKRSKDLRVALRLCLGLLQTEGLPGFRDGLQIVTVMTIQYWSAVYPRLDPDDNNDPLERVNILASFTTPIGTFGDPFQVLSRLRNAPMVLSSQFGAIRMVDVERAASAAPASGGMSTAQIQAALLDTPAEKLREAAETLAAIQATVQRLDQFLTETVGSGKAVAFDALVSTLKDLQKTLAPYVGGSEVLVPAGAAVMTTGGTPVSASGPGISGEIRSRQDVVRVLDQICEYFKKTEPSSPLPLLLQRARRLVDMDFMALLNDLAPDSLVPIKNIAGIRE